MVRPSSPTTGDAVSIRLAGEWPDSCVPGDPQLRITGREVRIDTVSAPPGVLCTQALQDWERIVPVGKLAAGTYRVVVINVSHELPLELGRSAFEVR